MPDVLDYVRSKDPAFADVPDDTLTRYIASRQPEFLQDPQFKSYYEYLGTQAAQHGLETVLSADQTVSKAVVVGQATDEISAQEKADAVMHGLETTLYADQLAGKAADVVRVTDTAQAQSKAEDTAKIQEIVDRETAAHPTKPVLDTVESLAFAGPEAILSGARALAPRTAAASAEAPQQLGPIPDEKAMDKPLFELVAPLTDEERANLAENNPRLLGVFESGRENANQLTTPKNLTLLAAGMGIGSLGPVAARAVSIGFAAMMAKAVPEIASQLGEEYAKSEGERDQTKIAKLITDGAIATGFTALAGAHGVAEPIESRLGSIPTLSPKPEIALAPQTARAYEEIKPVEAPKPTPEQKVISTAPVQGVELPVEPTLAPLATAAAKETTPKEVAAPPTDVLPGQSGQPEAAVEKVEVAGFKRENPPQVAQPIPRLQTEFNRYLTAGRKEVLKGTEYLLPGFEEYQVVLTKPSGSKAKGTKAGWRVFEKTTGYPISESSDIAGKPTSAQEAIDLALQRMNAIGKPGLDSRISDYRDAVIKSAQEHADNIGVEASKQAGETNAKPNENQIGMETNREEVPISQGSSETLPNKDIGLWSELQANTREFNSKKATKSRKQEIIDRQIELRKELSLKGYSPDQIKGVEMLQTEMPKPIGETQQVFTGMGGAVPSELTGGIGKDIYGIAERVREERARAGQVDMPPAGEGISAPDSIDRGREILLKDAGAADKAMSAFEADPAKGISADGVAAVRAQGELLARIARRTEEKFGTDSPEYRAAWKNLSDWDARSKKMQTEWHKIGMAQQGETDIDTGTFTGMQRAFKDSTGKEFDSGQSKKAAALAERVRVAEASAEEAKQKLYDALKAQESAEPHIKLVASKLKEYFSTRAKTALERIKARRAEGRLFTGIDPTEIADYADYGASKILEKGIQGAEMTAEWAKTMVDDIGDFIKPHLKEIWDASRKAFEDGFQKTTGLTTATAKGRTPKTPEAAIWKKAKEYINLGADTFDDVRNKVATDLGLPVDKVTETLRSGSGVKRVSDELWKKQAEARKLDQKAKQWLRDQALPPLQRVLEAIPNLMFTAKVAGHGTVALGTHAPMGLFKPYEWGTYFRNFGKMYRMVGSTPYYERQIQDLTRRPNYVTARRAGLVNDPFQYEDYNSPDTTTAFGKFTQMGNRGYSVLKLIRQDMFDNAWNALPKTAQIPEVAKAMADGINHATGVVKMSAPKGSAKVLFAPRLLMSRGAWLVTDPAKAVVTFSNWKNATEGEKYFAIQQVKEKAWVLGTAYGLLLANQGFLSATGSNQKINGVPESLGGKGFDPMHSDFFKFKAAGMNMAYGNAMLSMARLPIRLYQIRSSDGGKLKNVIYPDESSYTVLGEYGRSQLSPFASLAADLWLKGDWQNRPLPNSTRPMPKRLREQGVKPYTWPEFWAEKVLPIPAEEAMREVWKTGMGYSPEQIEHLEKAAATLAIMMGTGARVTDDSESQKKTQSEKQTEKK